MLCKKVYLTTLILFDKMLTFKIIVLKLMTITFFTLLIENVIYYLTNNQLISPSESLKHTSIT